MIRRDDEYLESRVMTASPHSLHLMVIDGAIRHAREAQERLAEQNWEKLHLSLNTSREFVMELIGGLSAERAPELVGNLRSLFGFVYRSLVEADLERDSKKIQDAIQVLEMHRDAWNELGNRAERQPAESSTTSDWST